MRATQRGLLLLESQSSEPSHTGWPSSMDSSLVILVLAVVASLGAAAVVGQQDKLLAPAFPSCSTSGNYTDGSQFKKNLDALLAALPAAASGNDGFYIGTAGDPG